MTPPLARATSQTSETSGSVSDTDYAGWLTKADAAAAIGVTTKTVERLAADGKIQQGATQRQGRGPKVAVYHPDDVARIARERQPGAKPFVLPVGVTPPANGNGPHGSAVPAIYEKPDNRSGEELLRAFAVALRQMSETRSETPTLFLTIDQAAAVSGVSRAGLRNMIAKGMLPALKDRGWKIRRRDLEAL